MQIRWFHIHYAILSHYPKSTAFSIIPVEDFFSLVEMFSRRNSAWPGFLLTYTFHTSVLGCRQFPLLTSSEAISYQLNINFNTESLYHFMQREASLVCHLEETMTLVPIPSQMNPFHTLAFFLFKICLNILTVSRLVAALLQVFKFKINLFHTHAQ